ncbi:MAG: winged helix-turn-helix domain-containing protein [Ferruginibacter sp.]
MDAKQVEKISKALGDTNRLKILFDMSKQKGCIQCSEIMNVLNLAQPSVSHHIKTLLEAGLIKAEKDGRHYSYQLNKVLFKAYLEKLTSIWQV